jgi:hypothetical protein
MSAKLATALGLLLVLSPLAPAADKDAWYAKAVKSVEASFDPAEAKPGQTVTFKVTVTLNDGYYTYPLKQPEKNAKGMVNKIAFPKPGSVIFVGDAKDPDGFDTKSEPLLDITELRTYKGTATFERKAVVSPTAKPGDVTVQLDKFVLSVCDASNCYPANTLTPEAKLKVLDGKVEVAKEFAAEVKAALDGK